MADNTTDPISSRTRWWLYIRMVLGTGLVGIALGYYLQLLGRISMTPLLVIVFSARGMIVGALVWAFEIFVILGPRGNRLVGWTPAARFGMRIVAYLILGEAGFWIGEAIFRPEDIADLFHTAGGPN